MVKCPQCGHHVPEIDIMAGLCAGCHWDTWIPKGHTKREGYRFVDEFNHSNATCRPALGVGFLDAQAPQSSAALKLPPNIDERVVLAIEYISVGHTQAQAAMRSGLTHRTLLRRLGELRKHS